MPSTTVTPNQVVAHNLRIARLLHGWTQGEAAERLEPYLGARWSKATFSVAERSFAHPDRIRRFTADDLAAFAAAFDLPVAFFFRPPPNVDEIASPDAEAALTPQQLTELATRSPDDKRVAALVEAARAREVARFDAITATWPERKDER